MQTIAILIAAGVVGVVVGVGSTTTAGTGRAAVTKVAHGAAVATGLKRAREPQPGDHWGGCNDARAAGTAPIYRGEPGYRENMDGDGDGIACEPIR
ncbi:excalibur calcium-binding domain-containing protein [uncultured Sphingomonas sp.]|uniref:excalibur calcium-binding domain-containing protein n=1 Tax=uncultured Sphingomonas sp. TaxID=158754 RepID=UPI0025F16388|nr:excalibur calcium-binding domain-containing protein [uncultured Sphingomonas sp.]